MFVKICGIKSFEIAEYAIEQGAQMIGMVVELPSSPRNLTIHEASKLNTKIKGRFSDKVSTVVVSKKNSVDDIENLTRELIGADFYQIHPENPSFFYNECKIKTKPDVLKKLVIPINKNMDSQIVDALLKDLVFAENYFIIDSSEGRNIPFDLRFVENILSKKSYRKIIVSGGINSSNLSVIKSIRGISGIDLSSGLEKEKGVKSKELIKDFFETARTLGLVSPK